MIQTKTDVVRQLIAGQHYKEALRITKGFRLGLSRDEISIMTRAYECYIRPEFYKQIGFIPDREIAKGIQIINDLYGDKSYTEKE